MAMPGSRTITRLLYVCLLCFTLGELSRGSLWWLQSRHDGPCQLDNEGSWSIGIFKGQSPFDLWPLEQVTPRQDSASAWPVANPVLTCASVTDSPSNFVADPFLWQHTDGQLYLFYETKTSGAMRGEIGMAVSADSGISWTHQAVVLQEQWHLSYPFVFTFAGEMYMMPEGSLSGQLWLYRATAFPRTWVRDRVLVDRPLIDASLADFKGVWWLFGTDHTRPHAAKNGELEAWHAASPLGPWEQHALNPLIASDRGGSARSGGRPLVHEGRLYRFAQDCTQTYGHKLMAWEVTKLSPTEFEQRPAAFNIRGVGDSAQAAGKPSWHSARQHHLDVQQLPGGGWIAALDGDRVASGPISSRVIRTVLRLLTAWALAAVLWATQRILAARQRGSGRWARPRQNSGPLSPLSPNRRRPGSGRQRFAPPAVTASLEVETSLASSFGRGQVVRKKIQQVSDLEGQQRIGEAVLDCAPAPTKVPSWKRQQRGRLKKSRWVRFLFCILALLAGLLATFSVLAVLYLSPFHAPSQALTVDGQHSTFTLLCMSYDARMATLQHFVSHYSRCPSVSDVVIVWNKGAPPVPERDFESAVPVRIRVETHNSLNNRFNVDPAIHNRAVLSLDDDIMLPCADVERGFALWRTHPETMVGYFPRLIEGSPLVFNGEAYAVGRGAYNAVLTGAAFIDAETAFPLYWADAVAPSRAVVDTVFNGEDLLMNFVLGNQSGASAIEFLPPTRRMDISKWSGVGISHNFVRFKKEAAQYLANFTATFGYVPLREHLLTWDGRKPPYFCGIGAIGCVYL